MNKPKYKKEKKFIMEQNKIYSVLMLCNYEKSAAASSKWIVAVKSIRNNLLGTAYTRNGGWVLYKDLPKIDTSIVDIVESVDEAKEYLEKTTPDVIIAEDKIGTTPIGTGTLDMLRDKAPNAIFILLLDRFQKKGAKKTTKTGDVLISQGKKVESLYQGGYYNALFKNELDMKEICNMILSGGYSAEWAYNNYGLDEEPKAAEEIEETVTETNIEDVPVDSVEEQIQPPVIEMEIVETDLSDEENTEEQETIENAEEAGREDEDAQEHPEEEIKEPDLFLQENTEIIEEEELEEEIDEDSEDSNSDITETDEMEDSIDEPENTVSELSVKEATEIPTEEEEKTMELHTPINNKEKEDFVFPTISNSIETNVNYCHSKVSFVQNDTILLKSIQPLAKSNLNASKLLHYPVAVPYIKKDNATNEDIVYYCISDLSFVQDDTIVLRSDKSLSDLQIGLDTLENNPVAVPYINGERDVNKNLTYLFAKVTFVQDDILILHAKQPLSKKGLNQDTLGKLPVRVPYIIEKENRKSIVLTSGIIQFVLDDTIVVKLNKGVPTHNDALVELTDYLVAIPYVVEQKGN